MSVNECSENGPNYGARAVVLLYTVVKRKKKQLREENWKETEPRKDILNRLFEERERDEGEIFKIT